MKRKVLPILVILAIAIAFTGCSFVQSLTLPKTPYGIYYANSKWFNKSLENSMDKVKNGKMDKTFFVETLKPKYQTGDLVLTMWELALDESAPTEEWEDDFLTIKDEIIDLIAEIGGVK